MIFTYYDQESCYHSVFESIRINFKILVLFIFSILFIFVYSETVAAVKPNPFNDLPDDVRFNAKRVKYGDKKVKATGNVKVLYKGALLEADEMEYDEDQKTIDAQGNVRVTQEGETLFGEKMTYNMDIERAVMWDAHGATSRIETSDRKMTGKVFFWGKKIVREKDFIRIEKGIFTTCDVPKPQYHYHFSAKEAIIYPDDKLVAKNVGIHLRDKLLYNKPVLIMSLKKRDKEQNIFPRFGYNQMDGYYVRESLYLKPRKDDYAKVNIDVYQKTGVGGGLDYKYQLGPNGWGYLHLYQLEPQYQAMMQQDLQKAVTMGRIGKHEFSNIIQYVMPDNLYFGLGYSDYKYSYPQTGSTYWNTNNFYIGKTTSKYSCLFSHGMTNYQNLTYTNRNFNYLYKVNDDLRFRVGAFYSGYESSNVNSPSRDMWRYFGDVFSEGKFLDTVLSYSSTQGVSLFSFDKLPELTFSSRKLHIWDFPLNAAFSYGNYQEEPTRIRMNRGNFQFSTRDLNWPVGENGNIGVGGGFRQLFCADNSAKYVVTAGGGYYQDMGSFGARLNYFYQKPEGYSPFLSDYVGRYNLFMGGIDFHNKDKWGFSLFSGYDLEYKNFHSLVGRLNLSPWKNTSFDFGSSYDVERKYVSNINSQINLSVGGGFSLQHWTFYDMINKKFTYQDFCLSKEDHDFLTRVVYRSEQKEVWLQFALKVFPHETIPIGADPSKIIMPYRYR